MKKLLLVALVALSGTFVNAQDFKKMDKSPMDRAYFPEGAPHRSFEKDATKKKALEPQIRVTYSRPAKKERVVFGTLLKFDKPWRVGANESTEILFNNDVVFGGKTIKAGRYSIIVIPSEKEWTLKLNTVLDGWGSYGYDESKDVASVTVAVSKSKNVIENLSIALYETSANTVNLKIGWDTTIAEFPITLK